MIGRFYISTNNCPFVEFCQNHSVRPMLVQVLTAKHHRLIPNPTVHSFLIAFHKLYPGSSDDFYWFSPQGTQPTQTTLRWAVPSPPSLPTWRKCQRVWSCWLRWWRTMLLEEMTWWEQRGRLLELCRTCWRLWNLHLERCDVDQLTEPQNCTRLPLMQLHSCLCFRIWNVLCSVGMLLWMHLSEFNA